MAVSAALSDAQKSGTTLQRLGAKLAVAHQGLSYAIEADATWRHGDIELRSNDTLVKVGLSPGAIFGAAADMWNATISEAIDARLEDVLIEAIKLYRTLLPEVDTTAIDVVAKQLWGEAK
jgi:hypothetical protein